MSGQTPFAKFRSLLASGGMPDALESIASNRGGVVIACLVGADLHTFSSTDDLSFSAETPIDIGCIARNLTTLLLGLAVSDGRVSLEDSVNGFFPARTCIDSSLRIHHLLNQSHGLDVTTLSQLPYCPSGRIDVNAIWDEVQSAGILAAPGMVFYHYGYTGLWIAAAILEQLYDSRFSDLLISRILSPIGATPGTTNAPAVCPAYGGLLLTSRELLGICRFHLGREGGRALHAVLTHSRQAFRVPIPTWPSLAEESCPGWFSYGSAYAAFGYRRGTSSLMMLISPGEDSAIVVAATDFRCIHAAQRTLFESVFRTQSRSPRPLSRSERETFRVEPFVGRYQKGSLTLEISPGRKGVLEGSVYRRAANGTIEDTPIVTRTLLPALENTLYPAPPEPQFMSYIRFLPDDSRGKFSHATTGKHVFRRV